mmetsp:Transcript_72597/g.187269  ORF Transcript_72597/g.187269 Transcript_72597/m.187269 type:complete len:220 (+) Transcript_72597:1017-1676(+)
MVADQTCWKKTRLLETHCWRSMWVGLYGSLSNDMSMEKPLPKKPLTRPVVTFASTHLPGRPSGSVALSLLSTTFRMAVPRSLPNRVRLPAWYASTASASSDTMSAPLARKWPLTYRRSLMCAAARFMASSESPSTHLSAMSVVRCTICSMLKPSSMMMADACTTSAGPLTFEPGLSSASSFSGACVVVGTVAGVVRLVVVSWAAAFWTFRGRSKGAIVL